MNMENIHPVDGDGSDILETRLSYNDADKDVDVVLAGNGREFIFNKTSRTLVMGILNVTPDSFSDGGLFFSKERAVARAMEMVADGADIIDIGGESTRPGSEAVSIDEELRRVVPVITELAKKGVVISIDTSKADVAKSALDAGAWMVNDVSAMGDPAMGGVLNEYDAPVVLMHMRGTPATMQDDVEYANITAEIVSYLSDRIDLAVATGLSRDRIVIDPGLGFGKSREGNFTIIRELSEFKALGRPVLVGASRKSFLGGEATERLMPTVAVHTAAIINGADIIRVHDVAEAVSAARISETMRDMS
jgi:dihydropteroate synthase